jgi:hypothetical protein
VSRPSVPPQGSLNPVLFFRNRATIPIFLSYFISLASEIAARYIFVETVPLRRAVVNARYTGGLVLRFGALKIIILVNSD